jgi:uncharacterized protein
MGFTPDRELPIVWKIAKGSLKNKFFFLLPGALLLSAFAPWAVMPILMIGGAYLCFEAAEKILEAVLPHDAEPHLEELALSSAAMEAQKVGGAIRTDLILSGEIMAISLAEVADQPFAIQAGALVFISLALTAAVYGVVGLIVKMDDIGVHLAQRNSATTRGFGRALVKSMPVLLQLLAVVGTAAMLWVGGGILVHGLHEYHLTPVPGWVEGLEHRAADLGGPIAGWVAFALGSAVVGLVVGGLVIAVVHLVQRLRR